MKTNILVKKNVKSLLLLYNGTLYCTPLSSLGHIFSEIFIPAESSQQKPQKNTSTFLTKQIPTS